MGKTLLSAVLKFKTHILLLVMLLGTSKLVEAQSLLLPGDVTIVTVNGSAHSFDIIPLVDIEPGTNLYVSNSALMRSENGLRVQNSGRITFNTPLSAGTNLTISDEISHGALWEGNLQLTENGDSLYLYQQDDDIQRFIFGLSWGEIKHESELPVLPEMLSTSMRTWVRLGRALNHQYHLKNGASGTPSMLLNMVGDPANWRSSDAPFSSLSTSFRLLAAPVVIFDENINTITEGDSIILNVAIYGHDGSRLTVDVDFEPTYSTADTNDVQHFKKQTINFTGLIGDAVYAITVPTNNDVDFEGDETAFFELRNLSKGQFGDFINHVAFIRENDPPKVSISQIVYSNNEENDFIEIQNEEGAYLDISEWSIAGHQFLYPLIDQVEIEPFGRREIKSPKTEGDKNQTGTWISARSGTILLKNELGMVVASQSYRMGEVMAESKLTSPKKEINITAENEREEAELPDVVEPSVLSPADEEAVQPKVADDEAVQKREVAGWFVTTALDKAATDSDELFYWNEVAGKFAPYTANESDSAETSSLFYFEEHGEEVGRVKMLAADDTLNQQVLSQESVHEFSITISATDTDESGYINEAEGFNFFTNFATDSLSVGAFIQTVEAELGKGFVHPELMLWPENGTGWMGIELLLPSDVIPPRRSFWVKIDSAVAVTSLLLQSNLLKQAPVEVPDIYVEPEAHLQLTVAGKLGERNMEINWYTEGEKRPVSTLAPSLLEGLSVFNTNFLEFGGYGGSNWNSAINLVGASDSRAAIPLAISSSHSEQLTLTVSGWESVSGWRIFLEDLESGEAQELDVNMPFVFEFSAQSAINFPQEEDYLAIYGTHPKVVNTRYQVVLYPPGVEVMELDNPTGFELFQNYPNPFNPATTISFYLPETAAVKLQVFNVVGQPITTLENGVLNTGEHQYEWNATGFPSGMYIYQLEVGTNIMTRKMTLVK